MAVTTTIDEYNTVSETLSADVANINMGSDDSSEIVPATYPITAHATIFGFEKWIQMNMVGVDNKVDNLQVWLSAGTLDGEADLKASTRTATQTGYLNPTFGTPTQLVSTDASWDIEEADPGEANLGIGGALAGNITTDGVSDYLVLQYQPTASHPAGDIGQLTLTFQWDEQ